MLGRYVGAEVEGRAEEVVVGDGDPMGGADAAADADGEFSDDDDPAFVTGSSDFEDGTVSALPEALFCAFSSVAGWVPVGAGSVSLDLGNETWGPIKNRCSCAAGNSRHSWSQQCGGNDDSALAPRIKTLTCGLPTANSSVSGAPIGACRVLRSARTPNQHELRHYEGDG
jgi:hypothetical protein